MTISTYSESQMRDESIVLFCFLDYDRFMNEKDTLVSQNDEDRLVIEQAFKQFSLETNRLERAYTSLEEQYKSVQRALHESQTMMSGKLSELEFIGRYLETILHHISQGILFIDLTGTVTTCNEAAEQILGKSSSELLFQPIDKYFNNNFFGFSLEDVLKSKRCPRSSFITLEKGDGKQGEVEIEATFVTTDRQSHSLDLKMPGTSIQGILILLRDMTEVRRLQRQAERNSRLRELGEMAAHLAHEIRNPLGGIKGFASLLVHDLTDKPQQRQMATNIVGGANDLDLLVSGILSYTRPFEAKREPTDLQAFIDEVRQLMQADEAWNKKIKFDIKANNEEGLIVPFDPQLLKSALLNLFVNAVQAMPNGGKLTVTVGRDAEHAIIRVEDTGKGIPTDNLDNLFTPFFTTKEKGTGLGLSEVHKVIQAHHGSIEVNSEVGIGTSFIIKLPR